MANASPDSARRTSGARAHRASPGAGTVSVSSSAAPAPAGSEGTHSPASLIAAGLTLPDNVVPAVTKSLIQGETKHILWDFSEQSWDTLELLQVTDVQWGHLCCNVTRVLEYRDWVLAAPNRFMIWTGDNVDAATMLSKGGPWDNRGTPQDQVYEFTKVWGPARHRVLGYVGGNHERHGTATFGDLGVLLSTLLRLPYSRGKQHIDILFGQHRPFLITQWHGSGGARTFGAAAQALMRFAEQGDSQLYLMGHLHKPMVIPFWKERHDARGVATVKTVAALGSSFLEHWGSYAEVAGYAPSDVLMPLCQLDRDGGWEVRLR